MDPFTIISLVTAIVSVVFAATGPILPRLWHGLKRLYGGACQSTSYLRAMGKQRLTNDIHAMMLQNAALRAQANRYYLEGGIGRSNQHATSDMKARNSGANRAFIEFSDFSD